LTANTDSTQTVVVAREAAYATITPAMIAQEESRVGGPVSLPHPHIELTSRDAIRHWAEGIGDRNPLWTDEAYAKESVWGDIIAPPTIVEPLTPSGISGFRAVHAWHLGLDIEWNDVIRRNQTFKSVDTYESLKEVTSAYAGKNTYDQVLRSDLIDVDTGKVVAVYHTLARRFERTAGKDTGKYKARTRSTYTADELQEVARKYATEKRTGSAPHPVSGVSVGDSIGEIIRGPLTSTDCITFVRGWGGAFLLANGFAWDFITTHPGAFPPDRSGVPDSPERTHWDIDFAQDVGAVAPFDYGPQRISWCGTLVTNWMGDAAMLRKLSVRLRKPGYHGDLVTINGHVTAVDPASRCVDVAFEGLNQLGEISVNGTAQVQLAS
jgi:acyl dehydratase